MKYRIWHIPQVPMKPFRADVESPQEAQKFLNMLADYDVFQLENKVKPDYTNASGLEIYIDGGWEEWQDESGEDIFDTDNFKEYDYNGER